MYKHTTNSSGLLTPRGQRGGGVDMRIGLRQTTKRKDKIQPNARMGSALLALSVNLEQQAKGLGEADHDKAASYRSDRDPVA
jgi:hypothetical protein